MSKEEREEDTNEFVAQWKQLDGKFDTFSKLKEMRSLVAKGQVPQEVYDDVHRYVLENNLAHNKKAMKKKKKMLQKTLKKTTSFVEKPLLEGHLYKRSMTGGKNWRKRYFKLFLDRLEYYKKKGDKDPAGCILLTKNWYAADSILRRIKNARKNGFMLSDFSQTLYLAAETPEDKTYWMHTIALVLRKLQESDAAVDRPILMGQTARTKSAEEKELKARLENYRKLNGITEAAKRASQASQQSSGPSRPGSTTERKSARRSTHRSTRKSTLVEAAIPQEEKTGEQVLKEEEKPIQEKADDQRKSKRKSKISLPGEPEPDTLDRASSDLEDGDEYLQKEDDDEEKGHQDEDEDGESYETDSTSEDDGEEEEDNSQDDSLEKRGSVASALSKTLSLSKTVSERNKTASLKLAAERESKARSLASAAFSAHESARQSVQSNLGLNVMSYAEQQDLRDQAAEAEKVKLVKELENEAAMSELEVLSEEQARLKKALRQAIANGDEDEISALEEKYLDVKLQVRELEQVALRSAAERAEAEEVVEKTEEVIAEANAANSIVLELAKVDEAILHAEQLLADAESSRKRAEQAANKVREDALKESQEKERQLAAAEKAAAKAAKEEEERFVAEQKALEKLESIAAKKVSEKQKKKVEELAKKAAVARAEAEEKRFQAELKATELETEKLDAMAKAAAVEKALRETQALIEEDRSRLGMEAYGFAALRREKEEMHREQSQKLHKVKASATTTASSSQKAQRKRSSFMNRLRGTSTASAPKSKTKSKQHKDTGKEEKNGKREKDAATKAADAANQSGPLEASSAFMSFFQTFSQAAVDGIEYLTGFRLGEIEEDEETLVDDDRESLLSSSSSESEAESDYDDRFDEQLRKVGEQERMKAAAAWIEFEINRLLDVIHEIGVEDEYGRPVVTFGQLLEVYEDISDTLVGILLRAKRAGKVWYEGDMLFEIENDDTEIIALDESE